MNVRMATSITVKNIPENIYTLLKKRAVEHHICLNNEIITIFEKETISQKIDPKKFLRTAR